MRSFPPPSFLARLLDAPLCRVLFARPTSARSASERGEPTNPRRRQALVDRARPHPLPAPSRWLLSASRLRPSEEAPGVAKGSGSRERRSLTYFPQPQAHAYSPSERHQGDSRGIARAGSSSPQHLKGLAQVRTAQSGGLGRRDPRGLKG